MTSHMPITTTPVSDLDAKIDIIDHINDDHHEEVLTIAHAHGQPDASSAVLSEIYEEGCQILVTTAESSTQTELWVPFVLKGDLEEQILYLAYSAMSRQGKSLDSGKKQYFDVIGHEYVTPHMLRLHLTSQRPFPENMPGFAWLFSLKTLNQLPTATDKAQPQSRLQQWMNRLLLWSLRYLSIKRREKIMMSFTRDMRYYTLRQVTTSDDGKKAIASVDVYIHGDTPGGNWARHLQPGDIIVSTSEYEEHTEHLANGRALLIADETSLPTIAALLEHWHNPVPPYVISITQDPADKHYLDNLPLPAGTIVHHVHGTGGTVHDKVIQLIRDLGDIDVSWGAMEHKDAKLIRKYLREERGLEGKANRIKGYWKHKEHHHA